MSLLIALDSSQRTNSSDNTDDFTTSFSPAPALYKKPGYAWMVALHKANLWYSFYNVSDALYNNNTFLINLGAGFVPITLDNGIYNINQLNVEIQSKITAAGGTGASVAIVPDFPRLKIGLYIDSTSGYIVDLDGNNSNLYKLFGFTLAQATTTYDGITPGPVVFGDLTADITNGLDNLYINCNLVRGSWFGSKTGRTLYSFTPSVPPGASIEIVINNPIYLPIDEQSGMIKEIRMYITDNQGRRVDFNGEDMQFLLHFKLVEI